MTRVQHTPGPWHTEPLVDDQGKSIAICGAFPIGIIAVIPYPEDGYAGKVSITRAQDEYNAEFIAAAPETAAERDALKALTGKLVVQLKAALAEIDFEIQQRQYGGNNEDWCELKRLSDEAHAAVREANRGAA